MPYYKAIGNIWIRSIVGAHRLNFELRPYFGQNISASTLVVRIVLGFEIRALALETRFEITSAHPSR
jgi:hypothetical protein